MSGVDLSTTYLGLELDNPLVPSASPLSRSLDNCRRLEDAGAAAIVMYSLYEEELRHDEEIMTRFLIHQEAGRAATDSFLPLHQAYQRGQDQYLEQLATLKESLDIPVIASLNGVSRGDWVEQGKALEQAGADALELNAYYIAADPAQSGIQVEERYLALMRELHGLVGIPISVKLSPHFSSIPHMVEGLAREGADGVVLFNRFYQPDIEPETLQVTPRLHLSTSDEALLAMRWIAILYGRVSVSLAATGGIHTAMDVVKMLLAGAHVTHLCSALLKHGPEHLIEVKADLERWLEKKEYQSVSDIQGLVSQRYLGDPAAFERANYVWVLDNYTPAASMRR